MGSCTTGKKAFEKGDYYSAVLKAVNRLRSNASQEKAREALRNAYLLAVQSLEESIHNAQNSPNSFKWVKVVNYYERISKLYNEVKSSPGALSVIPNPFNPVNELKEAKENAAGEYYEAGEKALALGTRDGAKSAYNYYVKSRNYSRRFRDVQEKIKQAKDLATLRVVVETAPQPAGNRRLSSTFFQQKLHNYIFNRKINEFVQFYTQDQALNSPIKVDQIIRVEFVDLKIGESHTYEKVEKFTKDSIRVDTETEGEEEKPVYESAFAKLKTFRKELLTRGTLHIQVFDAQRQQTVLNKDFKEESVWVSEWARYEGDKRALTSEQQELCKQSEQRIPESQVLFERFGQVVYNDFTPWLSSYYKKY